MIYLYDQLQLYQRYDLIDSERAIMIVSQK